MRGETRRPRGRRQLATAAGLAWSLALACGTESGAAPEGGAITGKGSNRDDERGSCGGCPAEPGCGDRDACGSLCLPVCDQRCARHRVHYGFWVSTYEVDGTEGWGRHQGIAVLGADVAYDTRLDPRDRPELAAHRFSEEPPAFEGVPSDVAAKLARTDDLRSFARCGAPTLPVSSWIGNHGRALSREEGDRAARVELEAYEAEIGPESVTTEHERLGKLRACLGAIPNGYCDAVCGNCSYVLPEVTLAASRAGDWSRPSSAVHETKSCTNESYYGGPGQESKNSALGYRFPNAFTHCARLDCDEADEAPSIDSYLFFRSPVVSGRYGHNSNTDAEAEYQAFLACVSGQAPGGDVCKVCGESRDAGQRPCEDRTNTADTTWKRTVHGKLGPNFEDDHPIIQRSSSATTAPAPPRCRWAPFDVNGM